MTLVDSGVLQAPVDGVGVFVVFCAIQDWNWQEGVRASRQLKENLRMVPVVDK